MVGLRSTELDWTWIEQGSCRGEDQALFFGDHNERPGRRRAREERALAVCRACPVRARCLEHALTAPERHGVWGAHTEDQLALLRRRQRVPA